MNKNRFVTFMMVLATIIISSCTDSRSQQTNQNTDETGTSIHASQQKGEITDSQNSEDGDGKVANEGQLAGKETEKAVNGADTNLKADAANIPDGAAILMKAYPEYIKGYEGGKLQLKDGTQMVYDDGRKKSFEQKLDDADPEDMFAFRYDRSGAQPEYLQDAGRSRCEALFKKMYGASPAAVERNLVSVDWFGQKVRFTKINGADKKLRAVAEELKAHPEFKSYFKSEGTYYWRPVRGAKRLSAHSYGMTIDIGGNYKTYWLWSNPGAGETSKVKYENKMPMEIVRIFERHGFIWGGRWYHYDTMHFEYRPEILLANP